MMRDSLQATSTASPPDLLPHRVLAIMPHPDDAEYYCGGTLAWWAKQSVEVFIAVVTDGGKGSRDPAMITARSWAFPMASCCPPWPYAAN